MGYGPWSRKEADRPEQLGTRACLMCMHVSYVHTFCFCLVAQSCLILRPHGLRHARLPVLCSCHLPEFAQTHIHRLVMPSNHLILCHKKRDYLHLYVDRNLKVPSCPSYVNGNRPHT